jgi:signal transduction histidine kinase
VTIQADERRRISRELHDEIGQQVTALSLRLAALEPGIQDRAALEKCLQLLDQLGRQLHDLAVAVRPAGLEELGLVLALSSYVEDWAEQHGVKLDFHQRGLQRIRLSAAVEDAAYRIVIEALSNVAKHSGASRASVLLERRDSELRIIVEDNGKGFDVEGFRKEKVADHLGVVGMEERAALLDGAVTLESRPGGGGTTLYVKLPLAPAPRA